MAVKVRQRDGKWWVYIDHKGKRKAKCIGISKRAAEIVAEKIEARLALGHSEILEEGAPPLLFADYARQWLKTNAAMRCKPATVEEYETICRLHILPPFGAQRLSAISREAVKQLVAEKIEHGFSRSRVSTIMAVVRAILTVRSKTGISGSTPRLAWADI
jgi:integrase